ncbi:hypothetical protein TWF102_006093 [Orbilia oligospora]|uniref:Phosphatidylinositol-glycan-specific phospholipase D n=1 Tax=Orbilia oligospora TaxID=2813651 RepID=A0A7C8JKY6_ORBOL|nr:hypothetical protein TWF102_006093 [Orbilia oligospora]KAF3098549.1 hypothetical protein TWF103_008986 [Orbilia oligospora]
MARYSSRISSLICSYLSFSIILFTGSAIACGVLTHNEILRRARYLYSIYPTDTSNHTPHYIHHAYINNILSDSSNRAAQQAGAFFPDWGYGCFSNDAPAEAAHWPPFVAASIRHFHKKYGPVLITSLTPPDGNGELVTNKLWPNGTTMTRDDLEHKNKLISFIFAVALHGSSDATWHSLKMYNGFIRMVAGLDFSGSYSDAHTLVDTGGDVILANRIDNLPPESHAKNWVSSTWWVPTSDILEIYESMGITTVNRFTFSFCIARGLAAIQAVVSASGALYEAYAEKSPAMVDFFDEYYLGGMDEMAANAVWCWRNVTEWMVGGAEGAGDGWGMCDTFQLIKARDGGKIEPPDPPAGKDNDLVGYGRHGESYGDLLRNEKEFRKLVEKYEDNIYQDDLPSGAVEIYVPDNLPWFERPPPSRRSDEKQRPLFDLYYRDDDDSATTTKSDKFHIPLPTPSPFPGSFGEPIFISTAKAFSKFGSYLSIGSHGTSKLLKGFGVIESQEGSIDLTASALSETEDQDYIAGGAVYSIDLKDVTNVKTVYDDEGRMWAEALAKKLVRFSGRDDGVGIKVSNFNLDGVCGISTKIGNGTVVMNGVKKPKLDIDTTFQEPNHPNARFGAATTAVRLKLGVFNVVTAPGPQVFNASSPRIGFIPSGYLDLFLGPQRILRLAFEDLPGGDRIGEREFGTVVLAADIDGDGEEEVIIGMPFADSDRPGCGVQLAEGEVVVIKMGKIVESVFNGCDGVVEGAIQRLKLPSVEKRGEECGQNTYEWFGKSLVWVKQAGLLGVGAPGRGKVFFWGWEVEDGQFTYEFSIEGGKGGFGGWGLESGVTSAGKEWVAVGVPDDDVAQKGHVQVYRIVNGEGVLVARVKSWEDEKFEKFGMVLRADNGDEGLWVGSPWAQKERGAVWWIDIGAIANWEGNWKKKVKLHRGPTVQTPVVEKSEKEMIREFQVQMQLMGPEPGAHFGAALASVDINGDGKDDLVVGIPYWAVANPDENSRFKGAVAVFTRIDGEV